MANTISEWLMDGDNRVLAFQIEQPTQEILKFHELVAQTLMDEKKELDPFWVSSRGKPYLVLALEFDPDTQEPKSASYIVGVKDKVDA